MVNSVCKEGLKTVFVFSTFLKEIIRSEKRSGGLGKLIIHFAHQRFCDKHYRTLVHLYMFRALFLF